MPRVPAIMTVNAMSSSVKRVGRIQRDTQFPHPMGNENGTEDFVFCSELLDHRNARLVYCSISVLVGSRTASPRF